MHKDGVTYADGVVNVPDWGVTLRTIFGIAVANHDIMELGRNVELRIKGVRIGSIQLKDDIDKGKLDGPQIIRKAARRI